MKVKVGLIIFFLVWVFLEGIFRKWITPGLSSQLFFAKYLLSLIFIFLILIKSENKVNIRSNPFTGLLLCYLVILVFGTLPSLALFPPLVAIVGLLIYSGFIFLVWGIPEVVINLDRLKKFVLILSILLIISFLLGIVQYYSPPDAYINKYAREMANIATVGDSVRITSVFSYIGPLQALVIFSNLFLLACLVIIKRLSKSRLIYIFILVTLTLSVINTFMTGSRGAVGWSGILVCLYIVSNVIINRNLKTGVSLSFIAFLIFLVMNFTSEGNKAYENFMGRVESSHDVENRVLDSFDPFKFAMKAGPTGYGIGSTYQGVNQFISNRYDMPDFWEEESERIVLELGWLGFLLVFIIRLLLFLSSIKIVKKVKHFDLKLLALVFILIQLPTLLMLDQSIFNWMSNIIYWSSFGFLVAILNIDHKMANEA